MGLAVIVVERRRDGKLHPVGGRLPEADRQRAVSLVHAFRCRDGLSYRQVVRALEAEGLRVSLGTAHAWTRGWTCRWCRGAAERTDALA